MNKLYKVLLPYPGFTVGDVYKSHTELVNGVEVESVINGALAPEIPKYMRVTNAAFSTTFAPVPVENTGLYLVIVKNKDKIVKSAFYSNRTDADTAALVNKGSFCGSIDTTVEILRTISKVVTATTVDITEI